jgi:hypothetical protein
MKARLESFLAMEAAQFKQLTGGNIFRQIVIEAWIVASCGWRAFGIQVLCRQMRRRHGA